MAAGFDAALSAAARQLESLDTLTQRDGADAIYDAWFTAAKAHAKLELSGGPDEMRRVTLAALGHSMRSGTSFLHHELADDYIVS